MFNMRDRAEMPCDYDGPPIAEIFVYSIRVHLFCAKQKQCSDVHNDGSIQVCTNIVSYYRKQLYTVVIFTLENNLLYCLLKNAIM